MLPGPADIRHFNEQTVKRLKGQIEFCRRLERKGSSLEELRYKVRVYGVPAQYDFEEPISHPQHDETSRAVLYELGVAAGATTDHMGASKHAQVHDLCWNMLYEIQQWIWHDEVCGTGTAGEMVALADSDVIVGIATEYRAQLEAITEDELRAEADAACRRIDRSHSPTPPQLPESDVPVYIGNGRLEFAGQSIILQGQETAVLEALIELRSATLKHLGDRSRVGNPSQVLSRIWKKHVFLRPFITLPGAQSQGGYRTNIADQRVN